MNERKCVETAWREAVFRGLQTLKPRNRKEAGLEVAEIKLLRLDVLDVKPERPG